MSQIEDAINTLVIKGKVSPLFTEKGILYQITDLGSEFIDSFNDDFCDKEKDYVQYYSNLYETLGDDELIKKIMERG